MDRPADRMMQVLAMADLFHREARVLAAIAFHDGPGGAWVSDETLAREAGLNHRQAAAEVRKALRTKGRLTWKTGKTVNLYTVHYDCPAHPDTENGSHCPDKPNSEPSATLSGSDLPHCPAHPDTNRKEQEGPAKEESACACGLALTVATSTCPACGMERPLASPWRGVAA